MRSRIGRRNGKLGRAYKQLWQKLEQRAGKPIPFWFREAIRQELAAAFKLEARDV